MERKWRWRERWMVGSICAIAYACWQYLCWQVRVSTRSPAQRDNSWEDTHHTQEKKLNGTIKQICCTNKCDIMFSFSFLILCEMRYKINKHIFITRNIFFLSIIRVVGSSTNSNRTYYYTYAWISVQFMVVAKKDWKYYGREKCVLLWN